MKTFLKINHLSLALLILSLFALASCSTPRYAYSPSAHNVPVLEKKGDGKLGAFYSTNLTADSRLNDYPVTSRTRGADVQGAYAITDNIAIQANYYNRWEKTTGGPDTVSITYHRNITELGLGYYMPLSASRKNIFFQVFLGGGLGKFSFTDLRPTGSGYFHDANVTKIYIQPGFVYRSKGSFSSAVSLRASIINFSKIKTNYSYSQLEDYKLDSLNSRSKVFFEPAFTGSFGLKGIPALRFEFQAGVSFLAAHSLLDYHPFCLSLGTYMNLGDLLHKKAE